MLLEMAWSPRTGKPGFRWNSPLRRISSVPVDSVLKHPELVEEFERELSRRTPPDLAQGLAIVEALLDEARLLGV